MLDDRFFYMAAPKLWNNLSLFIRNIFSVNSFKKSVKTYLLLKMFLGDIFFDYFLILLVHIIIIFVNFNKNLH